MSSKRNLRRDVEELSDAVGDSASRSLRQNVPYGLIEEWEEHSGRSVEWLREANL